MVTCTIFRNIFAKDPNYITVDQALERIKQGRSRVAIDEIRSHFDKKRADQLKANLPSICFSGKFSERTDEKLLEHSGFIVLDFDEVNDLREKHVSSFIFCYYR